MSFLALNPAAGQILQGHINQSQRCVVLLDSSGSVRGKEEQVKVLLKKYAPLLVITFGDHKIERHERLEKYKPFGNTPMRDALKYCMDNQLPAKKVYVLTDGKDTGSKTTTVQLIEQMSHSDIDFEFVGLDK